MPSWIFWLVCDRVTTLYLPDREARPCVGWEYALRNAASNMWQQQTTTATTAIATVGPLLSLTATLKFTSCMTPKLSPFVYHPLQHGPMAIVHDTLYRAIIQPPIIQPTCSPLPSWQLSCCQHEGKRPQSMPSFGNKAQQEAQQARPSYSSATSTTR